MILTRSTLPRRPSRLTWIVGGLLLGCHGGAHRNDSATGPTPAVSTGPATAAPLPSPSASASPPGAMVDARASAEWSAPPETLLTRPGPIWRLVQTQTHILWLDPADPVPSAFDANVVAVAKATPAAARTVATARVPAHAAIETAAKLAASGTNVFFVVPTLASGGPVYERASIVDVADRGSKITLPLPPALATFDANAGFVALGERLIAAASVLDARHAVTGSVITISSPRGPAQKAVAVPGSVSALAAGGSAAFTAFVTKQTSVIARIDVDGAKLEPLVEREGVDALAAADDGVVWSEIAPGRGMRPSAIQFLRSGGAPVRLAVTEWPHALQVARGRVCWSTFRPRAGVAAYDERGRPSAPVDTYVLCVPLNGGPVERAVGPIDQEALGFAVDEHHVYWAVVQGGITTLRRRAVPR